MESSAEPGRAPLDEIIEAFRADKWQDVRRLLNKHPELRASINEPIGPFGSPAILNVASREMLDVLIDAGADLNVKSDWWAGGFGLLHTAPQELAVYAIERGATIDAHAAARLGLFGKLRELVLAEPELVHARGGDGQTPLHFAATVETAEFLLDQGAHIDALDIDHESTPAQWMIDERQEIVRFLIGRGCKTDILMAAALGDADLVLRILEENPEAVRTRVVEEYFPMVGCRSGGTIYQWKLGWYVSPLDVARKFDHPEVLEVLVDRSPAVLKLLDAAWSENETGVAILRQDLPEREQQLTHAERRLVVCAARNNTTTAARLLLECGLPVDAKGQHLATALHWAAFHGNTDLTALLLEHRAPVDIRDADFSGTPLKWAMYGSEHGWNCRTGDYAGTVELLLRAGSPRPDTISGTRAVQEVLRRIE